MYEETAFFDPNSMDDGESNGYFGTMSNEPDSLLPHGNLENSDAIESSGFGQNVIFPVEEFSYKCNLQQDNIVEGVNIVTSVAEAQFQQQMIYDLENCYNDVENNSLMQEAIHEVNQALSYEQTNWVASGDYDLNGMCQQEDQMQQVEILQNGHGNYSSSALLDVPYPSAPDLLNLLHLSRSPSSASFFPNSTISFSNALQSPSNFQNGVGLMDASSSSSILYDPLLHLNLPPQPPIFKDLFQSLPHGLNLPVPMTGSLFARMDDMDHSRGMFHDVDGQLLEDGVLEFTADMPRMVKGRNGKIKRFPTERDRRDNLNNKYTTLKSLIPSPKKVCKQKNTVKVIFMILSRL